MNCPVCNVPLNIMDRQGVEIDYCPRCRGVWLDRGELDKILERSAAYQGYDDRPDRDRRYDDDRYRRGYTQSSSHHPHHHPHHKKKREGFLDDLFDFD